MATLYIQLANRLQALIEEGGYREGERVPGVRVLSRQFGVSISTVLQAYQTLEAKGYLQARERSGYYVRLPAREMPEPRMPPQDSEPQAVSARDMTMAFCADEHKRMVPLASAIPDPKFLPLRQIQKSTLWAARQGLEGLDYAFPGKERLRRLVARRMASLGVAVSPDEILITNGAQEAIILSLQAITEPGDIVAVEAPSFPGILQALEVVGLRALEIPSHPSEGVSLEGLQLALEQWPLKACVVVPNHSNPMGACMSTERKQHLVSMLALAKVPLIEDDIYGDLNHFGERPLPAKAFDKADNVIYCSSFSKTVSPGLRVGWMIPGRYLASIRQRKYFLNLATSSVSQLAVAHFLENGGYEHYLRKARRCYQETTERLRFCVARAFPEQTAVSRPRGGFVLWVQLPEGVSGTEIYRRARLELINVAPGVMFSTTQKFENCLRLNTGNPWTERIETAVIRLGSLAYEIQAASD